MIQYDGDEVGNCKWTWTHADKLDVGGGCSRGPRTKTARRVRCVTTAAVTGLAAAGPDRAREVRRAVNSG
jgi:hypothetical protein